MEESPGMKVLCEWLLSTCARIMSIDKSVVIVIHLEASRVESLRFQQRVFRSREI